MVMVPTTPTDGEDHGNSYCYSGESSPSSDAVTNWQIAHGSLESAVTFESSDSPIDPDSIPKSPVIVKPPSLDSGPCEIKICFAQRHEIQQVYVRSTARVYEIYYASSLHGENQYLCTVRCSVAEREGEILLAGIEDASKQHVKVIRVKNGSNSEEDWVDVEVPDLPVVENGINCLVKQAAKEGGRSVQELYEATAQISDAEPCASLTIRLLSLQSKDCLYIDEVYIFGDPFVSTDSENHSTPVESSAQSSLMAMLVPTLLQLSKSGASRTNDKYASDRQGKDDDAGPTARGHDMTDDMNGIHCEQRSTVDEQHVSLHADDQLTSEPVQSLLPTLDLNKKEQVVGNGLKPQSPKQLTADEKNNMPDIERVLVQLVDRVNRIEDICLRFEESMLKPINSMEVRLQRVEEQVEILAKNSQYTGIPSCNRISAPSFSCTDSNFGSFYNDGNDHPPNLASELKMDFPDDKLASQIDNSSISASSPRMHPSCVIAAPEFSCGEEEEDSHVLEPSKNSPEVKRNLASSIDNALAAALSGFLSTSVTSPAECTQNFEVTASEHSGEIHEKDGDPLECSPSGPVLRDDCIRDEKNEGMLSKYRRILTVTAPEFTLEDLDDVHSSPNRNDYSPPPSTQNKSIPNSVSISSDITIELDAGQKLSDKHTEASEVVDFKDESCTCESNEANDLANPIDHAIIKETTSKYPPSILFPENNCTKRPLRDETETKPESLGSAGEAAEDDASEQSSTDILGGCRYSVPSLDFEIPILEVNFGLQDDSGTKLPLEVLLGDTAGICATAEETNITVVDDDVERDPLTITDILVDYTCANVDDAPSHPYADPAAFISLL
ncbi:uncharacterized protein LOC116032319 [Ipomoea triloba]|uniref:uncharacterized protein LOC116032319 n=1 Tax=Ipomoea triloba TaxID=35885 RepID=UPI00125E36E6|nr:uncharacterized protein LOC116032319 [Ipomoea triloba]